MKLFSRGSTPSWWVSLIPFVVLIAILVVVIKVFGADALEGGSQVSLLMATGVIVAISMIFYRIPWKEFEEAIVDNVKAVATSIIILLLIGAVAGTWMVSGVVPTMIYYGMKVIFPSVFLFACCGISAVIAVMTGSSWTTIATVGVALVGIGTAQGYEPGWIAGAIISGAYFGDKISPMSETTVLASSTTGTPLFVHIKYMMYTTIPAFLIGLLIFMVAGWNMADAESVNVSLYAEGLSNAFTLSPWLMIVPIVTAVMIARRLPAIVILFCATIMACVAAVVAQSNLVDSIAGSGSDSLMNRFRGVMILVYGSTGLETGVPELNDLVATRGMAGMMSTVWLIFCAMIFGASMSASGMIESIMRMFVRMARNTFTLVGSTVGVGLFMNVVCADQYLSLILTGNMFKEVYQKMGYENRLLSRTTEDAVTVTSVLVPWNSCGMTQSMVLGVSTLVYLPYCFFNYLSPCFTLLLAAMEYKIRRKH